VGGTPYYNGGNLACRSGGGGSRNYPRATPRAPTYTPPSRPDNSEAEAREKALAAERARQVAAEEEKRKQDEKFQQDKADLLKEMKDISPDDLDLKGLNDESATADEPDCDKSKIKNTGTGCFLPKRTDDDLMSACHNNVAAVSAIKSAIKTTNMRTHRALHMAEVACIAHKAGFNNGDLADAIAVAHAESGFDQDCVSGPNVDKEKGRVARLEDGSAELSFDYGLWQINNFRRQMYPTIGIDTLRDSDRHGRQNQPVPEAISCALRPACAAKYAHELWEKKKWEPWGAYRDADPEDSDNKSKKHVDYLNYRNRVLAFLKSQEGQATLRSPACNPSPSEGSQHGLSKTSASRPNGKR
jgi:hypothetical protein